MSALIMLACGFLMASLGVLTLSGRRPVRTVRPRWAGWGFVLIGAGFVLDGVPRTAGWSSEVGARLAGVAMVLILLGGVLGVLGGRPVKRRDAADADLGRTTP
ncbi:hypothetical protein ACWD4F_40440 [Streptomyces aureus]